MMGLNMITDILGKNSVYGKCYLSYFFLLKKSVLIILYSVFKFYFSVFLRKKGITTYFPVFSWEEDRTVICPFSLSSSDHPFLCLASWTKNGLLLSLKIVTSCDFV